MKVFIIYYLFRYIQSKLNLYNLLKLYISVFSCLNRDYSRKLAKSVSREQLENTKLFLDNELSIDDINQLNIYYNTSQKMIGGAGMLSVFVDMGVVVIATLFVQDSVGSEVIEDDWELADLEEYDKLLHAISEKNYQTIISLLENGFNPNIMKFGETPLLKAIVDKDYRLVKILLEGGADPNFNGLYLLSSLDNDLRLLKLLIDYDIKYDIYGPISMYYFRIPCKDGSIKKILLFGDEHSRIINKCNGDCIYYDDYINLITERCQNKKRCVDLYIEQPLTQIQMTTRELKSVYSGGSSINPDEDTLMYTRRIFEDCSEKDYRESEIDSCLGLSGISFNNLRVHNIDLRLVDNLRFERLFERLYQVFERLSIYSVVTEEDYSKIIRYILGYADISEDVFELVIRQQLLIDYPLTSGNLIQLRWIRDKINKEHIKFMKNKCFNEDLREIYYTNLMDKYKKNKSGDNDNSLSHIHLIDFYTLLRMFIDFDISGKKSKRGPRTCRNIESQNRIIAYTGNAHTINYIEILKKCFGKHLVFAIDCDEYYTKILEFKNAKINKYGFTNFTDIIIDFEL